VHVSTIYFLLLKLSCPNLSNDVMKESFQLNISLFKKEEEATIVFYFFYFRRWFFLCCFVSSSLDQLIWNQSSVKASSLKFTKKRSLYCLSEVAPGPQEQRTKTYVLKRNTKNNKFLINNWKSLFHNSTNYSFVCINSSSP